MNHFSNSDKVPYEIGPNIDESILNVEIKQNNNKSLRNTYKTQSYNYLYKLFLIQIKIFLKNLLKILMK